MAERRMFSKTIIGSDLFTDLPFPSQSLYVHLAMNADDEGFLNNAKKIQRMIGATENDLQCLIEQGYIIKFDSGVIVITHWKIHNYIRNDRFKETIFQTEKASLGIKENGEYSSDITGIPYDNHMVYQMDTQDRIGNYSTGKSSLGRGQSSCSNSDNSAKTIKSNNIFADILRRQEDKNE